MFSVHVLSRFAHFHGVLTARSHEAWASLWTVGAVIIYLRQGLVIWHVLRTP